MHEQITLFGEEIEVVNKAKRFEDILKELEKMIYEKSEKIDYLEERAAELLKENKELKAKVKKPQLVKIGAFDISRTNYRPFIHTFVDWIGYSMFIGSNFENMPNETQTIYHEVWKKHIRPMYKEFCESCKNDKLEDCKDE